jgi:putative Ca2+/H+ antiporter (TMEM165/GDT1 family)
VALDLGVLIATFAVIFPAELPDNSFIAALVLATRYPRLMVWLGASAAFVVHTAIAVSAGARTLGSNQRGRRQRTQRARSSTVIECF